MAKNTKINVTLDFNAEIGKLNSSIDAINNKISQIELPQSMSKSFIKLFSQLSDETKNFLSKSGNITNEADFNALEKSGKKVLDLYRKLEVEVKSLSNLSDKEKMQLLPEDTLSKVKKVEQALKAYNSAIDKNSKATQQAKNNLAKYEAQLEGIKAEQQALANKKIITGAEYSQATNDLKKYKEELKSINEQLEGIQVPTNKNGGADKRTKEYKTQQQLLLQRDQLLTNIAQKEAIINNSTTEKRKATQIKNLNVEYQTTSNLIKNVQEELKKLDATDVASNSFQKLVNGIKQIEGLEDIQINSLDDVNRVIKDLTDGDVEKLNGVLRQLLVTLEQGDEGANDFSNGLNEAKESIIQMVSYQEEVNRMRQNLLNFFSIDNAVNLFKRAVRSAYETVKELDAAMTETAVVTDFSVGDMWDQLPRYTKAANELGTTTLGAYQTMTLFYQQGLKTNEVFEIGTETMKMARIANMDYADATDKMTAALRGFNMELNETSAQRVNDVYSELAAITAADTNEIATAMTKTASIADSANMEFETTAAFLSQIIETTRESAETAGTAMKTVVARFQELKKDPAEIGEVDGEIVDANKIETALRTINVALRDTSGQFRDLDDVFLEIASKWNTLDTNTQRYIATMAAGSRQQSRFIAMMSNYDRTMELVNAANNSAGASQKQFEKTTESLESKLNKLSNAWNAFTMNLANSEIIKFVVDLLTNLLTTINSLIDGISGNNDILKTFVAALGSILAFKVGRSVLKGGFASFTSAFKEQGTTSGKAFRKAFIDEFSTIGSFAKKRISGMKDLKNLWSTAKSGTINIPEVKFDPSDLKTKEQLWKDFKIEIGASIDENQLETLKKEFESGWSTKPSEAVGKLDEKLKEANKTTLTQKASQQQLQQETQRLGNSYAALGTILLGVGAAAHAVADGFEKAGNTQAADGVRTIANTFMILGGVLQTIPTLATWASSAIVAGSKAASLAIKAIPIIGWIAAAVAAVGTLIGVIDALTESDAERAERFEKNAEQTKKDVEEIKNKYEELNSTISDLSGRQEDLKNLTRGTDEWKEAVQSLNQELLQLVSQYPDLLPLLENNNGVLTIDFSGKGYQDFLDKETEKVRNSQIATIAADYQKVQDNYEQEKEQYFGFRQLMLDPLEENSKEFSLAFSMLPAIETGLSLSGKSEDISSEDWEKYKWDLANFLESKIIETDVNFKNSEEVETFLKTLKNQNNDNILKDYTDEQIEVLSEQLYILKTYSDYQNLEEKRKSQLDQLFLSEKLQNLGQLEIQDESLYAAAETLQNAIYDGAVEGAEAFDPSKEAYKIDEEDKQEYAAARGLVYENGNYYAKDEYGNKTGDAIANISDDTVRTYKAIQEANKDVVENLEEFESFYNSLVNQPELQRFLSGQSTRLDLKEIEVGDLSDLTDILGGKDALQEFYDNLKLQQKELYKTAENLVIKGSTEDSAAGFIEDTKDSSAIINKIGTTAFSGLAENLYNVVITQGKDAATKLYNSINTITEDMGSEEAEKFVGALNLIDWESTASIESFKQLLIEFGISIPEEEVEDFIENMKDTTKAIDELTFDQLQEKLLGLKDVIDNVTSKIEDDIVTFTQEEMDSILATGAADRDDFIFSDIDEYTFIGDTESLLASINSNVAKILGLQKGNLEDSIAKGEKIADYFEDETKYNYNGQTLTKEENFKKIANDRAYGLSLDQETLLVSAYNSGAITQEEYSEGSLGVAELVDRITSYYQNYANLASNQAQLDQINQNAEEYDLYHTDAQYQTQQLKGKKISTAEDTDGEQLVEVLKAQATNYGVTTSKIEEFNKALEANGGKLDDATAAILTNAIAEKKAEKAYAKTSEEIREVTDNYEDLKDITDEDTQLIGEALGLTDLEVGSENFNFVKENLDLIAQAAEGDIKAFSDLQDKLAEHYGLTINATTGNIDLSGLVNAQQDVENAAIAALNALLAAGSYEIESVTVEQDGEYDVPIIDEKTGLITGFKTEPYKVGQTYQVVKPIDAPSVKRATNNTSGKSSRKSSGGSKSKDWENPYDKFYNLTETINKNLREREKLERTYNKLLREQQHILNTIDYEKNLSDQISNLKQQADKLRREYALQSTMYSGKGNELQSYMAKNSSMRKYGYYDAASQQIVIDWNAINKVKNDEKGQKIEDYIGKLEELRDAMWDAEDAMLDAEEQIEEMKEDLREKLEELKQAYLDFEDRIVEALVAQRQAEIDELQEVYDLMSESNNSVLSAIQEVINEQRRLRELEEQKADIEEMQRRLAMLRQDTSGASDLEIKALEEQIGDAQQSYTDSLIDQAIDEMGTANEKAEEQRQQQIDLLQHQLDWDKENGKFWTQVNELLSTAINPDGSLNNNSPLVELLKSTEGYKAMSEFGKQNWWTNLQKTVAEAMAGLKEWLNPTDVDAAIGGVQGGDAGIVGGVGSDNGGSSGGSGGSGGSGVLKEGPGVEALQKWLNKYWTYRVGYKAKMQEDGKYGSETKKVVKKLQEYLNKNYSAGITTDGLFGKKTYDAMIKYYQEEYSGNNKLYFMYLNQLPKAVFKTGGVADFTGPAWLDGTKTHPEIVLNARDSANFLELRDILRDMNLVSEGKTSGGDNYFEIHIEVDTLSNDYDVEQVADKVKRIINDDARYRNTNAINLIR